MRLAGITLGGLTTLTVIRFLFGAGEAGAFPNIAKSLYNWFPASQRGFAKSIVWMAARFMGGLTPLVWVLLGTAAGLSIAGASLNDTETAIVVAIYVGLASSTVIVPIVATLVSPVRMQPRLVLARDWLSHNSAHITVLVLVMVGFVILGAGLSRL